MISDINLPEWVPVTLKGTVSKMQNAEKRVYSTVKSSSSAVTISFCLLPKCVFFSPLYLDVSLVWMSFLGHGGFMTPSKVQKLPTAVFLSGEFHVQKRLAGYSPRGHRESDMTEQLFFF